MTGKVGHACSVTIASNRHVTDVTYGVGVAVGVAVAVGVGLPSTGVEIGLAAVAVETALVGVLKGSGRVGVMDTIGVHVGVQVGVTKSGVGGGQVWRLTVNSTQSLP